MVNYRSGASQVVLVVMNLSTNAGDLRVSGLIPMSGRSPGGGHGHPLQYSFLENPMDRGTWWATVHRVAQCQTRLKQPCMHNYRTRVRNKASYSTRKQETVLQNQQHKQTSQRPTDGILRQNERMSVIKDETI